MTIVNWKIIYIYASSDNVMIPTSTCVSAFPSLILGFICLLFSCDGASISVSQSCEGRKNMLHTL